MTAPRATTAAPATSRPGFARRHLGLVSLLAVVGVPLLVFALWAFATLNYTYSRGYRTGYAQKFSRKGWVCKTWEGELAQSNVPGQAPQLFEFSVRDDAAAEQLRRLEGQRVTVTYEQHVHVPTSCFGETEYFVIAARPVGEAPFPAAGVPAAGAAPGTVR